MLHLLVAIPFLFAADATAATTAPSMVSTLLPLIPIPILFYSVFRLRIRTERQSRDLTEVTRALALEVRRREESQGAAPKTS